VEEAELFLQLKLMKDFFLLGRGELFLEFIQQVGHILQNPPISTSARGRSRELKPLWVMGCSSFHISSYSTSKTSVLLREEHRLEVLIVLRKIFGPKRVEVMGRMKKVA
jgi:hypothetical protein